LDVKEFLEQYGLIAGIVVWIIVREGPNLINFIKDRFADHLEHAQAVQDKEIDTHRLDTLIAMGSKTFTEEQLTLMTSETQTQLSEANEFIRKNINQKLDILIQKIDNLQGQVDKMPAEIMDDLRDDLRAIADNWKSAMIEYRHIQTKLTIMTTLFKDYYDKDSNSENETSL
jgi:hypothetical protein